MDMMDEVNEYTALVKHIAELQKKADEMRPRIQLRAALAVRAIMAEHNLTQEQVITGWSAQRATYKPKDPNKVQPIRYRDDNGNSWSGMGRAPRWIADAPDRSIYRIA